MSTEALPSSSSMPAQATAVAITPTTATTTTTTPAQTEQPQNTAAAGTTNTSEQVPKTTSEEEEEEEMKEYTESVGTTRGTLYVKGDRMYNPIKGRESEAEKTEMVLKHIPGLEGYVNKVIRVTDINGAPYFEVANLLAGYKNPRVMKVSVGESGDRDAIGYQPYGLRCEGYTGNRVIRKGVPQSWDDLVSYIKSFIKDKEANTSLYDNIPYWLIKIHEIQRALAGQRAVHFYGVSLLVIYDGVFDAPQKPTVCLTGFSRCVENPPAAAFPDHLLLFGLNNMCKVLVDVHQKFIKRHAVFLCRHGYRIDYGDLTWAANSPYPHDPPLSEEGLRQASDLGKRLKYENISLIVSSPFRRAIQTAKAIAQTLNVKYVVEPAFAEFISVLNRRNVPNLDPQCEEDDDLVDPSYTGIIEGIKLEDWDSMCERVHEALWKLSKLGKRIAIVSHRSTFQALFTVILGDK